MRKPNIKEKMIDNEKKTRPKKDDEKKSVWNRKNLMIAIGAIALVAVAGFAVFVLLPHGVVMKGDNVSVYYAVMFENGTVIDTNMNGTPLSLTVGSSGMIMGFSNAMEGMQLNQKKTITIPSDQAYGPYRSDLVRTVNRTGAIANKSFTVGQYYTIHRKTDNAVSRIRIVNVTSSTMTWDENSPLAGQNLTFTIKIVSVNKGFGVNVASTLFPSIIPTTTVPQQRISIQKKIEVMTYSSLS